MEFVKNVMDFEVLNMPVGAAGVFTASVGLGSALSLLVNRLTKGMLRPILLNGAIVGVINNVQMVKDFLGPELLDTLSLAMLYAAIDTEFQLSQKVVNLVAGILPAPAAAATETGGYQMGTPQVTTSALPSTPETMPVARTGLDDLDIAILKARGLKVA